MYLGGRRSKGNFIECDLSNEWMPEIEDQLAALLRGELEEVARSFFPMVLCAAGQYERATGYEADELVSVGLLGLWEALLEPPKSNLSTHVSVFIHRHMRRIVERKYRRGKMYELPHEIPVDAQQNVDFQDWIDTHLTSFEGEVLRLFCQGYSKPQIATCLEVDRMRIKRTFDRIKEIYLGTNAEFLESLSRCTLQGRSRVVLHEVPVSSEEGEGASD